MTSILAVKQRLQLISVHTWVPNATRESDMSKCQQGEMHRNQYDEPTGALSERQWSTHALLSFGEACDVIVSIQ